MKYPLLAFLLLIPGLPRAKAQTPPISTYHPVVIRLQNPEKWKKQLFAPFRHFEVLDQRPDTLRIGAHTDGSAFGNGNKQLILAKPVSRAIGDYLDSHFSDSGASYTALVVIRALWISDGAFTLSDISQDTTDLTRIKTRIRLKAEIYAERQGVYIPLFRYDHTSRDHSSSYIIAGYNLTSMLNDLADSAGEVLSQKGGAGRQLSFEDIRKFNRSRFEPVIYTDSALVPGVYKDFQEFKDNAPSIHEFEMVKEGKYKLLLYLKGPGQDATYSRNAWGYCDGSNIYIMKDGILVPAWKEEKAFYLLGQPEEGSFAKSKPSIALFMPVILGTVPLGGGANAYMSAGPGVPPSSQGAKRSAFFKHIFTVDMDTGKLY
jgi:hypothetical protein